LGFLDYFGVSWLIPVVIPLRRASTAWHFDYTALLLFLKRVSRFINYRCLCRNWRSVGLRQSYTQLAVSIVVRRPALIDNPLGSGSDFIGNFWIIHTCYCITFGQYLQEVEIVLFPFEDAEGDGVDYD
jgi:hypothetical protein